MFALKLRNFLHSHDRMCFYHPHSVYYFLILQLILSCHGYPLDESLPGRFPEAVLSGVNSLRVVRVHPRIKVGLQLLDSGVDFLSDSDSVELILHGSIKSFADTVCLWAFRLNFGMLYVLHSQIQFIFMIFSVSAVFRSPVCKHTHQFQVMLLEKRNAPIV